ncbi:MAG TPA: hypothetical protein VGM05_15020 [Planctomycetaceae bacterium]|jgi:hypothetical protein
MLFDEIWTKTFLPGRKKVDVDLPFESTAGDQPEDKRQELPDEGPAGSKGSVRDLQLDNANSLSEAASAEIAAQNRARQSEAKIRANRSDLGIMIAKNREERAIGGREWYLGFRLLRRRHSLGDPQEDPYIGAVVPIKVARKHPDMLGFLTLDYQTVYQHEKLDSSTRIVVRPGKLTTLRKQSRRSRWIRICAALIVAACGLAAYAFSARFWPFS